ncbi:unnamed protein product [Cuscuta epithymum]|uniref:Uncharacterized protein n=1 Tax=Cuscuta epithymum TaxID=186058 RepID=A0AAV0E5T6_9ASTE|nr:unnamed protein product [Cuscuta epithymum]
MMSSGYQHPSPSHSSLSNASGCNGVCMMSNSWRDEQHPSFLNFVSSFLHENSFRLNFVPITPDIIINCGGLSIAFIFLTNWDSMKTESFFCRVKKLKEQFANFYVVVTLPTKEQNDCFNCSYFKYNMELGKPTFIPVRDLEMGWEKIVKIAHARGVCKKQHAVEMMKAEKEKSVQSMDAYLRVVTSIPGIDKHDANAVKQKQKQTFLSIGYPSPVFPEIMRSKHTLQALAWLKQAIGSIEAIAKASKECILENTDLSVDKAERISLFFRDPKYFLRPKIG